MGNENNCCDICYDEKILLKVNCCKGKKWCESCKLKVLILNNPKCPFCRTLLQSTYLINSMKTPPNSHVSSPHIHGITIYSYLLSQVDNQPSGSIDFNRFQ